MKKKNAVRLAVPQQCIFSRQRKSKQQLSDEQLAVLITEVERNGYGPDLLIVDNIDGEKDGWVWSTRSSP